ncbi:FecCD family ABC transporter permease [Saccharopolyspora elongata]|uniref:Iron ABC transporter permease n=1 Tax=Saccharopolyspora elongata TaxID=2530387 RepID=A0A4R4ZFF3_9PSEU|nr:iron ABC transporter permease [Saccharopolyspora elongata]TDD55192.1 iron ABC transporter permease [Saccharopolyspora elongata]
MLLGAAVALAAAAVLGIAIGAQSLRPAEVLQALVAFDGSSEHLIIWDVRVPRVLLGISVGAALAVAGGLIQTLSRNPLAEPGILGVTVGAGFAVAVGSALGVAVSQLGELLAAIVGAVLAALLVYAVGRRSPLRLVLTGVALSAVLSGLSLGLRLMNPEVFDQYRFWAVGSLAGREQVPLEVPLVAIGLALVAAMLLARSLNAIELGETVARTLGTRVARVRVATLVVITVLTGAATALAGPILFVGLIVPHLARRMAPGSIPWQLAYTAVLGAVLMLLSDVGARVLLPTGEVPVAIVTGFLGGPVLIWAVRRYGSVAL